MIKYDLLSLSIPCGTIRYRKVSRMSREELDRIVEEFLKAELEDPEVQQMLVSFEGD